MNKLDLYQNYLASPYFKMYKVSTFLHSFLCDSMMKLETENLRLLADISPVWVR